MMKLHTITFAAGLLLFTSAAGTPVAAQGSDPGHAATARRGLDPRDEAHAAGARKASPVRAAPGTFDPLETFAPFRYAHPVSRYRSADGLPGPDYWQNRADYEIHARLDPAAKTLTATEVVTYTNNSPDTLAVLWLQLDQNRYRSDARANFSADGMPAVTEHTDGYRIESVRVEVDGAPRATPYVISDTRMRIDLPRPLPPAGGTVRVHIAYSYVIPGSFGGRTDWFHSRNGDIFEIAQWYPRLCVYDDLHGWDTLPFLNNEFYLEYGDFDYFITVPWNMIVVGSGELVNPEEVLTAAERARLAAARMSDTTVMIIAPDEVRDPATRPVRSGELTWHFRMERTRDVAFGASAAYIWDAARINLPGGRTALAMSAYPVESAGADAWGRSTEYLKYSTEIFSEQWYPYPYPVAVAEAGIAGGMEYPGIVFDSYRSRGQDLFSLTAHEIGHTWFPMVVGSNERRAAWMDEGFNTFIDIYASDEFNGGEYAPKRDGEYAPGGGNPVDEILPVLDDPAAPPIRTRPDLIAEKYRHPVTYFKAALGLVLLREQILGPERFDPAFRRYIAAWAFKHPSPDDFFRAMNSAAGEDLSWFWRGWFENNWTFDQAVTGIAYVDGDPRNGAVVTVANLGKLVLPATLEVTYVDGATTRVRVPVATWMQHHSFDIVVPGTQRIRTATLDPDHVLPDDDRGNNMFPRGVIGRASR
ncbi:MAG TPA: M1 family metallopeptidase [Longimicrobiales bacterium]